MSKVINFFKNEIKYPTIILAFVLIELMCEISEIHINIPYYKESIVLVLSAWLLINIKSIRKEYYFFAFIAYLLILIFSTSGHIELYDFFANEYRWNTNYFEEVLISELLSTVLIYFTLVAPIKDLNVKRQSHNLLKIIFIIGALIIDAAGFILKPGVKSGLTNNVNALASINLFAIVALISVVFEKKKYYLLVLAPIYIYFIFVTGSRAPLLSIGFFTIGILVYIFMFGGNGKKKLLLIASFLLIAFILIILFGPKVISYILRGKNFEGADFYQVMNSFTSGRWYVWVKTFPEAIKNNYIFGRGLVSLRQINLSDQLYIVGKGSTLFFTHNMFIDMIIATGFAGLFYFLIFLLIRFVNAIKNKDRIVDAILLFAMLIYFSFDTPFLWLEIGVICFYVIYG